MGLQLRRQMIWQFFIAAIGASTANTAAAQPTVFESIALNASVPFVRFDHTSDPSQFIVGFADSLSFWSGNAYSVRVYRTALSGTLVVDGTGVGVGVTPTRTFHVGGDALIEGNLEISSSRELKSGIAELGGAEAMEALSGLTPVSFTYKASPETKSLGFVAEDVPALVATKDRKTLRTMDIVAVLTRALQEQQRQIDQLTGELRELRLQAQTQ